MKKIVIIWEANKCNIEKSLVTAAEEAAKELEMEVILFPLKKTGEVDFYEYLKKEDADYLLSFDMAGFEKSTLQETSAYNILYAKQIHVLLQDDLKYRQYLCKELALNLFLFISDKKMVEKYQTEYSHILNMEAMQELIVKNLITEEEQQKNKEALKKIMEKVRNEVETAGTH